MQGYLNGYVLMPETKVPVVLTTDVIVIGGGPAGISASIAAARNGAQVVLVERYGFLGGTATACLCSDFQGVDRNVQGGIFIEILDRMVKEGSATEWWMTSMDSEAYKTIGFDLVERAGVKLLLHTYAVDVIKDEDMVNGIIVESKSGKQAVLGSVVVDASADGDISVFAGAPFMKGSRMQGGRAGKTHALSTLFNIGGVDIERLRKLQEEDPELWGDPGSWNFIGRGKKAQQWAMDARATGELYIRQEDVHMWFLPRPGEVQVNSIHIIGADPLSNEDLTRAEVEARKMAKSITDYMKKHVPGFENAFLAAVGIIGVRESRRVIGDYVLTDEESTGGKMFDDAVAIGNFMQDIHGPEEFHEFRPRHAVIPYDIPYRCLIPKNAENLLVSGRCISCDFRTQSSLRSIPTCTCTGQAAGTAAALSLKERITPRKLDIGLLQNTLIEQGCKILRTVPNLEKLNEEYKKRDETRVLERASKDGPDIWMFCLPG